jgi:hypothetical protein
VRRRDALFRHTANKQAWPITHHALANPVHTKRRLLIGRLHWNVPDVRTSNRFTDRLGVVVVILAVFAVRFDDPGGNDPGLVAQLVELTGSVVRAVAGFEASQTRRALRDEGQLFISAQWFPQDDLTVLVCSYQAETCLRQIDTYHCTIHADFSYR